MGQRRIERKPFHCMLEDTLLREHKKGNIKIQVWYVAITRLTKE